MREGCRSHGRSGVGALGALRREPADARQPVGCAHHEASQVGRADRRETGLQPAEVAAEGRDVARADPEAGGAQECPIGDRPAGARRADQEAL
jgi:hypothetical protein